MTNDFTGINMTGAFTTATAHTLADIATRAGLPLPDFSDLDAKLEIVTAAGSKGTPPRLTLDTLPGDPDGAASAIDEYALSLLTAEHRAKLAHDLMGEIETARSHRVVAAAPTWLPVLCERFDVALADLRKALATLPNAASLDGPGVAALGTKERQAYVSAVNAAQALSAVVEARTAIANETHEGGQRVNVSPEVVHVIPAPPASGNPRAVQDHVRRTEIRVGNDLGYWASVANREDVTLTLAPDAAAISARREYRAAIRAMTSQLPLAVAGRLGPNALAGHVATVRAAHAACA